MKELRKRIKAHRKILDNIVNEDTLFSHYCKLFLNYIENHPNKTSYDLYEISNILDCYNKRTCVFVIEYFSIQTLPLFENVLYEYNYFDNKYKMDKETFLIALYFNKVPFMTKENYIFQNWTDISCTDLNFSVSLKYNKDELENIN